MDKFLWVQHMLKTTAILGFALFGTVLFGVAAREGDPKPLGVELGGHLADMRTTSGKSLAGFPVRDSALILEFGASVNGGAILEFRDGKDQVTIPWAALALTVYGTVDVIDGFRASYFDFEKSRPGQIDPYVMEKQASADPKRDIEAISEVYVSLSEASWPLLHDPCPTTRLVATDCEALYPASGSLDRDQIIKEIQDYMRLVEGAYAKNDYDAVEQVGWRILGSWQLEDGAKLQLGVFGRAFAPVGGRPLRHLDPAEMELRPQLILEAYSPMVSNRIGAVRDCLRELPDAGPWSAGSMKPITSALINALGPPIYEGKQLNDPIETVALMKRRPSAFLYFWDHRKPTICAEAPTGKKMDGD
ncbi:hypothetical protein KUV57_13840 [Epibacterium sp. DP7N7-1]|nr:hypothetical protein [Epibacterium sp. DP7N7-1]